MRMSKEVEVDGPFGSSGKFMYVFGLVFVVVGVIAALMFFGIAHAAGEMLLGLGGLFILAIFGGVGGFIAYLGHKKMHENDAILSNGVEYQGKIYDYEPDYEILVNGQPCITLVVRYMDLGQVKEARVRTDASNATPYPRRRHRLHPHRKRRRRARAGIGQQCRDRASGRPDEPRLRPRFRGPRAQRAMPQLRRQRHGTRGHVALLPLLQH